MNTIRQFLRQDSWQKRGLLSLVFAVLLLRALLSGTVMLDPDAPAGSYGLVICSGFGPMFDVAADSDDTIRSMAGMHTGAMGMHRMPEMQHDSQGSALVDASHSSDALPAVSTSLMGDHTVNDHDGVCPFSAVFLTSIVSLLLLSIFLVVVAERRIWGNAASIRSIPLRRFSLPLSRGPPVFA